MAELGEGPLVLLLHGFPEFWWAWRHQMAALAEAGFRAAAMDLRGYGASDKPPLGYDLRTAADDVSGVIGSLGADHAVLVGHGLGGTVAWTTAHLHRERVWALACLSAPHPHVLASLPRWSLRTMVGGVRRSRVGAGELARSPEAVTALLGGAGGNPAWVTPEVRATYADALTIPFAAHCATEFNRYLVRFPFNRDGRRLRRRFGPPLDTPVLLVWGEDDPEIPEGSMTASMAYAPRRASSMALPGVGHFPHEEAAGAVSGALVDWLDSLA